MNERARSCVHVIDDDDAMRTAMHTLLDSCGYAVRSYARAEAFLDDCPDEPEGCIVIDVRMPELDGLACQRRMTDVGLSLPVIFVSGYADVALSVRAMQQGAFTFLTKPFRDQDLLDAIAAAVVLERDTRAERRELRRLRQAAETLTEREREIMADVTDGKLNKTIAARLGLSEITVKIARSRIMQKMGAGSLAQLARIAERIRR